MLRKEIHNIHLVDGRDSFLSKKHIIGENFIHEDRFATLYSYIICIHVHLFMYECSIAIV